ncbi:hypothetical protein [Nocardioides sp.]|uniref:hypothetical protein n=1 Tax=Nocardioides sp. TaxID=35761 RepID=UPI002632F345|nr:hypothetical protein [Nocardioides sp.]MCW2738584.1 hypothetical protein [Nocardioides sp.]
MTGGSWRDHLASIRPDAGYGVWPIAWGSLPTTRHAVRESYLFERPLDEVVTLCAEAPAVAYALGTPTGTAVTWSTDSRSWGPDARRAARARGRAPVAEPGAWWPADRAWATSNDTDLDSTLVGRTRAMVDDLLADDRLEVLPWPTDGSLWSDADSTAPSCIFVRCNNMQVRFCYPRVESNA